jgi:uncharacterized protein YbjT (DUF2867 family)
MDEYSLAVDNKGSKTTVQGDAKVIQVDYSDEGSIKHALTGVDVVISTIAIAALEVQGRIVTAAKEAGVKLFVPSEFGGIKGESEANFGMLGEKTAIQGQLKALGLPYTNFYTGPWADYVWAPCVS